MCFRVCVKHPFQLQCLKPAYYNGLHYESPTALRDLDGTVHPFSGGEMQRHKESLVEPAEQLLNGNLNQLKLLGEEAEIWHR